MERVRKGQVDELSVKWKDYDNSFNSGKVMIIQFTDIPINVCIVYQSWVFMLVKSVLKFFYNFFNLWFSTFYV